MNTVRKYIPQELILFFQLLNEALKKGKKALTGCVVFNCIVLHIQMSNIPRLLQADIELTKQPIMCYSWAGWISLKELPPPMDLEIIQVRSVSQSVHISVTTSD